VASATQVSIRKLVPDDAEAFQAIRLRGLLEIPSAFSASHEEEADTPLAVIAERLTPTPEGSILGAFFEGTLAGIIGIQRESQKKLAHKAYVWGMYVAPEFRRAGVGRALVSRALEIAGRELGVRSVSLGVNTRNDAAIALYTSMGFRTYGTEVGFLKVDGELHDEHMMARLVANEHFPDAH
jgi:ribosomal protein S18 acetylase RimI-like enzyme